MTAPNNHKRKTTVYTILLSVCLFLGVICACLLVALVLIGKNLALQNKCFNNEVQNVTNSDINIKKLNDGAEISVKINLSDNNLKKENEIWHSGWRLPRDVTPVHYNLKFNPVLTDGVFSATNNITITVKERRDHIIVNSHLLNITKVKLFADTGEEVEILDFHDDVVHQLHIVDFEDALIPGTYYLYFEFNANLKNRSIGFYSSYYYGINGDKRYIATSKLEPTYARQAFPCFDEPNYKAKYTVQIIKPADEEYIALSNMNQLGEPELINGTDSAIVRFNTSVPMSTYLACFIVCDFKYTETTVKASVGDDVILRVYATPAQQKKTQFALQVAKDCTSYYIDYYAIEYPLPKLDMIAIPDFVSGAMEHWGLVTFRETALLYDAQVSSSSNQQRVATVVAHELAHMWFGNLVTLNWWNDLWLNEGFATYMQFKATDHILPEWGMIDQFIVAQVHPVLQFDASLASHPIVQTVETPDQITEIFDCISYNKGASILRMLESAVGEEKFKTAISNYLKKYKYSNAVTKNLWDEIQAIENDFNVVDVMDTWTVQMGFPILSVSKNGNEYVLTQKRFLTDPENENLATPSPYGYKWTIPVTYITDKKEKKLLWFDKSASELKITIEDAKWVKFNEKQIGYYRINYPRDMWPTLSDNIKAMNISDKTHLLDDSFSIAKSGLLSYDIPLTMTKFLKEEENYVVWDVAASNIYDLKKLLINTPVFDKFQKYVQSLVEPIQQKLTWTEQENDKHLQKLTRATVTRLACSMGHQKTLEEAAELFKKWLNEDEKLSQDTKSAVYYYGMVNGIPEEWDKLYNKYMNETDAQEKSKLMDGLTAIRNPEILTKLLDLAKNETVVRGQDYFTCLQTISSNPVGTALVWDYVRTHWTEIVDRFTLNDRYLGRMVSGITSSFSTKVRLHEMEDFFKRYPNAGAGATARKQALEKVANNIKWVANYIGQIESWLNENVKN